MDAVITEALPIKNPLIPAVLLYALTAAAWGQDAAPERGRALDLSVPSGALTRTWGSPAAADTARLPGLGEQPGRAAAIISNGRAAEHRRDLPYGAGYEARHGLGGGGGGRGPGGRR